MRHSEREAHAEGEARVAGALTRLPREIAGSPKTQRIGSNTTA